MKEILVSRNGTPLMKYVNLEGGARSRRSIMRDYKQTVSPSTSCLGSNQCTAGKRMIHSYLCVIAVSFIVYFFHFPHETVILHKLGYHPVAGRQTTQTSQTPPATGGATSGQERRHWETLGGKMHGGCFSKVFMSHHLSKLIGSVRFPTNCLVLIMF